MTHGQTALLEGRARRSDGVLGHALSTSATHSPLPSGKARGSGVLLPPARPPRHCAFGDLPRPEQLFGMP